MIVTDKSPDATGPIAAKKTWGADAVLRALVPGAFWVLPVIWAAVYLLPPVNFDSSLILAVAQRWLGGERLYVDLIDVNPPLIFVLNLVPAGIAKLTGISGPVALVLSILAFIAVCVWLSLKLIPLVVSPERGMTRMILPPLLLYATVIFPGDMFSQREHLMTVPLFPYVLLAAARVMGAPVPRTRAWTIAILAAIGFGLKPYFLGIPALIELYILVQRGPKALRDPVPWIMLVLFVVYPIATWIWLPQYFTDIVPLVMSAYESLGGATLLTILLGNQLAPALVVIIPVGIGAFLGRQPILIKMLVLASIGTMASGLVQGKGWPYHLLPSQTLALVLLGLTVTELLDRMVLRTDGKAAVGHDPWTMPRAIVGLMMLSFISLTGYIRTTFYDQWGWTDSAAAQLLRVVKPYAEGKSILILSPGVYPLFPMLNYANAKLALRFQTIWPLQGAYNGCAPSDPRYHAAKDITPSERAMDRAVIEDFAKYQPPLVIIDKVAGIDFCGGKDFDLLEYFLRQPGFAREMAHYDLLTQYDRYIIYKRRPDVPEPESADE
jgi:hypothetical protein